MEVKVSLMLIVDGKINKYKCNVYTKLRLYINRPSTSVYMRVTRVHDTFAGTSACRVLCTITILFYANN